MDTKTLSQAACCLLAAVILGISACKPEPVVLVNIKGWPDAVQSIHVVPMLSDRAGAGFDVQAAARGFSFYLPDASATDLMIEVYGSDASCCPASYTRITQAITRRTTFPLRLELEIEFVQPVKKPLNQIPIPRFCSPAQREKCAGYTVEPPAVKPPPPYWNAVGGSASDDVWVFGSVGSFHWNGSAWTAIPAQFSYEIQQVWSFHKNDAWAVGYYDLLYHWDGTTWTGSEVEIGDQEGNYAGIWASGRDDVWFSSSDFQMAHWDGKAFNVFQCAGGRVWGSRPNDIWAVGPSISHWDGTGCKTRLTTQHPFDATAVWGSGSSDVWTVGWMGKILHWNGMDWSPVTSETSAWLYDVWGSGPNDVWAVGELGTILHWNGSRWSSVQSNTDKQIRAIWGSGPNDIYATGAAGVLRWDGSTWSQIQILN